MATLLKIAILDSNTKIPASQVQDWVLACEIQMNRDYFRAAVKSKIVTIKYYGKGSVPPADAWWIAVVDNADIANALGYHDLTPAGLPFGKVFVQTALTYGSKPSVTLSHELLEMLGDADVNVLIADKTSLTRFWAREVCDSVEAFEYTITLPATIATTTTPAKPARDVVVSDFVLQTYWNTQSTKGPWSFKNNLSGPVPALASGGYMAYTDGGVWNQIVKYKTPANSPKRALEVLQKRFDGLENPRRLKRIVPKSDWVKSTAKKVM